MEGEREKDPKAMIQFSPLNKWKCSATYKPTILQMRYLWSNLHLGYDDDCN